jgi:hypothetical protein
MVDRGDAYRILVERPDGKRPLGMPRRIWEDNIKMYLQEVGWEAFTELNWLRTGAGVMRS